VGVLDPFDPSWGDLPSEGRQRALDDATEPAQLARLALRDPDIELGLRAVAQICDDSLLADIASSSSRFVVAEAALARVRATAILAKIAIESKYTYIRAGAVDRIHDQPLLAEIAIRGVCPTTSRAAVARIRGRRLRAVIARQAVSGAARVAAAGSDAALIAEIALHDPDPDTRGVAVTKVVDGALVARIARQDPDARVREAAVRSLHDAFVLSQIAFEDTDPWVRTVAIERVADQSALERIALSHLDADLRKSAVARLTSKATLAQIASGDPAPTVRHAAVARVDDQSVLTQIAREDVAPEVRAAAIGRVFDQRVIASHARGDPAPYVRRVAINRLDDEDLLAEIARSDPDEGLRRDAIGRLHDEEPLLSFICHPNLALRIAAAERLRNLDFRRSLDGPSTFNVSARYPRAATDDPLFSPARGYLQVYAREVEAALDPLRVRDVLGPSEEPIQTVGLVMSLERSEARIFDQLASQHSSKAVRRVAIARLEEMRTEHPDALGEVIHEVALPELLAAARPTRLSQAKGAEPVDFSVFGPPAMAVGSTIMLQIFLHKPEQADEASGLAKAFDAGAERRGFRSLETDLELGSLVVFQVTIPKLETDAPLKHVVWRGRTASVQFAVTAPTGLVTQTVVGKVHAIQDGILIGHILFKLEVTETTPASDEQGLGDTALRYRYAFISYASADRNEVLKRVQVLAIAGIEFFQDLIKLKPGQRWQRELYRKIDESDLFLLFWSKSAKRSRWVLKEVRYAIARKGEDEEAPPEIVPVILGGPPFVKPPPDLAHLHFNDPIIYFMQ
jgi:hypothetical protein